MRTRPISALVLGLTLLAANPAYATTLDFEGLGLAEGTSLITVGAYPGVTFANAMLILPGNPNVGFNGNSSGGGAGGIDHANSGATIGYPGNAFGTTRLTFAAPIAGLSLELVDVEVGSVTEAMVVRVYDAVSGGTLLHTVTVTGGDPGTGDGRRKLVVLSGFAGDAAILRLEVQKTAGPIGSNPGVAIDNIIYVDATTAARDRSWGGVKHLYRR